MAKRKVDPYQQKQETRARAAKRLLDSLSASNAESLAVRFGKLLSALATLLSVAPVNGFLASGPLFLLLFVFGLLWVLCLILIGVSAYLVVGTHNASVALRFFLAGWVGVGVLSALCLIISGTWALKICRRWLSWNFSFLIGDS